MKKMFVLFTVFVLFSCKEKAAEFLEYSYLKFENAQPENEIAKNVIPIQFRGKYIENDSSYIEINDVMIRRNNLFRIKIHKDSIFKDSTNLIIQKDKIIEKGTNTIYKYKLINDFYNLEHTTCDTIFRLSSENVVKRVKNNMILSYRDSIYWNVSVYNLSKKILKTKMLNYDDLKSLDSIMLQKSVSIDSTLNICKPTNKEFSKFLKLKNIKWDSKYLKK